MEIIEEIKKKWKSKIDQISTINPGDVVIINKVLDNLIAGQYFLETPIMKAMVDMVQPVIEAIEQMGVTDTAAPTEAIIVETKSEPTEKELLEAKIAKLQNELKEANA